MATAAGPDQMVEPSLVDGLAHSPTTAQDAAGNMSSLASPLNSPLGSPRVFVPPPNPPFVFPARPSSSSAPSSFSRATGRRPRSAIDSQDRPFGTHLDGDFSAPKPLPLPAFSFNPGAALDSPTGSAFLSPPLSPQTPNSPNSSAFRTIGHGHRRGGSEFVGGNIRAGEAITVMSTSPTKSESGFASPQLMPTHPVPGRRGHAHRRSGAISSHDLSSILQPMSPNAVKGNSAPTSPAALEHPDILGSFSFPENKDQKTSMAPEPPSPPPETNVPVVADAELSGTPPPSTRPTPRARVGFSDTLEYIPRPLSIVSSDTSSTATARPGHSVSGSISSIISLASSQLADREPGSPTTTSPSPLSQKIESRPSTAGAILERRQIIDVIQSDSSSPRRRNSIPTLLSPPLPATPVEPSTPSPTKIGKRWSFFGFDSLPASNSPVRSRPVSASSSSSTSQPRAPDCFVPAMEIDQNPGDTAMVMDGAEESKSVVKKRGKKQKKVKSWAGSILSGKTKPRHLKNKSANRRTSASLGICQNGDNKATQNNVESSAAVPVTTPTVFVTESVQDETSSAVSSPRQMSQSAEDSSFPMIDLDAALGPFNTPLARDPEWEAAQRAGGLLKRPLHSAAGMSRFNGPGMHYQHRRAESAPEMAPFEAGRFGIHRFGSNSTMADVFEEEEEDESDGSKTTSQSTPQAEFSAEKLEQDQENAMQSSLSAFILERTSDSERSSLRPKHSGSSLPGMDSDHSSLNNAKFDLSPGQLQDEVIMEEPVENGMMHTDHGWSFAKASPNLSAPSSGHKPRDLKPVEVSPLHMPPTALGPTSPYSLSVSSAFPSPRSPMSYDANRVSTAPSSITEDNFQSLLMGEPGPEVRISVDIPSLTSSNSTMTRESGTPHVTSPTMFHDQQRPASFTSLAFGRRRSSLASIGRLISTSHGERSKLSMEVSMDTEPHRKPKASRTKRLSRMMQFWKPKTSQD